MMAPIGRDVNGKRHCGTVPRPPDPHPLPLISLSWHLVHHVLLYPNSGESATEPEPDRLKKGGSMANVSEHHRKAAEHFEKSAEHHRMAADSHDGGSSSEADQHVREAEQHHDEGMKHARQAKEAH